MGVSSVDVEQKRQIFGVNSSRSTRHPSGLSSRMQQVIQMAATGMSDKEMAAQLNVSTSTIDTYWKRIRAKVGARSRAQIINDLLIQRYITEATAWAEERQSLVQELEEFKRCHANLVLTLLLEKGQTDPTDWLSGSEALHQIIAAISLTEFVVYRACPSNLAIRQIAGPIMKYGWMQNQFSLDNSLDVLLDVRHSGSVLADAGRKLQQADVQAVEAIYQVAMPNGEVHFHFDRRVRQSDGMVAGLLIDIEGAALELDVRPMLRIQLACGTWQSIH